MGVILPPVDGREVILPPPYIGLNLDGGISDFQISSQSLIKKNCNNSRTSNDIDIKLGPVIKLNKKNTVTLKKFMMMSCQQIVMSLLFFQFMANLEQSGGRIPDAWSVKVAFSLTAIFYFKNSKQN